MLLQCLTETLDGLILALIAKDLLKNQESEDFFESFLVDPLSTIFEIGKRDLEIVPAFGTPPFTLRSIEIKSQL